MFHTDNGGCEQILNFVAYAFTVAILVTPMGSISVVIAAILSHFILKETLTFFVSSLVGHGATVVMCNFTTPPLGSDHVCQRVPGRRDDEAVPRR